jgi:hypothetical protein
MATRLYFSDTLAAPVTPPAPVGSTEWEHINTSIMTLLPAPDSSTLTDLAYTPDAADDLTQESTRWERRGKEALVLADN